MLGNRLRNKRKELGLTQAQMAERLNVCRQTVMKWERNITGPDLESIRLLAEYFGTTPEELLDPRAEEEGIIALVHSYRPLLDGTTHRAVSGYVIDSGRKEGIPYAQVEVLAGGKCVARMTADERGFFIGSCGSEPWYTLRFVVPGMVYEIPKIRGWEGETFVGGVDLYVHDREPVLPVSGVWGVGIVWRIDENGVMVLAGQGEMEDRYSDLSGLEECSPYRRLVKKVIVGRGITAIGAHAFNGFIHLEEVRVGKNVKRIGGGAFMGCKKLKSVTFAGDAVEEIGWNAFRGCVSLSRVKLPDSIRTVGKAAFAGCVSLRDITLPQTAEVYSEAFALCPNLHVR